MRSRLYKLFWNKRANGFESDPVSKWHEGSKAFDDCGYENAYAFPKPPRTATEIHSFHEMATHVSIVT